MALIGFAKAFAAEKEDLGVFDQAVGDGRRDGGQEQKSYCSARAHLYPILIVPAQRRPSLLMIALTLSISDQASCAAPRPLLSQE
jgi:hypothetical protein